MTPLYGRYRSARTLRLCSPGSNSIGPNGAGPISLSLIETIASVGGFVTTVTWPGSLRISISTMTFCSSPTSKFRLTSK